jgi:hypothetical protein
MLVPDLPVLTSSILVLCDATWYYSVLSVLLVPLLSYYVLVLLVTGLPAVRFLLFLYRLSTDYCPIQLEDSPALAQFILDLVC